VVRDARFAEPDPAREGKSWTARTETLTAAEKAQRYPAELQPNPHYVYELPTEVVINGRRCVEVDAGSLTWAADLARAGAALGFPKPKR
jgi:hypothetical protein